MYYTTKAEATQEKAIFLEKSIKPVAHHLRLSKLPPAVGLENRPPHSVPAQSWRTVRRQKSSMLSIFQSFKRDATALTEFFKFQPLTFER
ncbi:hypothetical protein HF569_09690 [Lactobacillus sp. ZJLC3-7]|nr:hypothetical protein [Levilactobacillus tujiorum]